MYVRKDFTHIAGVLVLNRPGTFTVIIYKISSGREIEQARLNSVVESHCSLLLVLGLPELIVDLR